MGTFKNQYKNIAKTMKTHLIDDLSGYGIWKHDYESFFEKRAEKISKELDKRIVPQKLGVQQPYEARMKEKTRLDVFILQYYSHSTNCTSISDSINTKATQCILLVEEI